jgi:hypothetical protein
MHNKSLKEKFLLIPYPKTNSFTIVFKSIIRFSSSNYPFLNAIIPFEIVVIIDSKIFVRSYFLQVVVFIYDGIKSYLIGFSDHDFSLVNISNHTHIGAKILEDS